MHNDEQATWITELHYSKNAFLLLFLSLRRPDERCAPKNDSERLKQWQRLIMKRREERSEHDWKQCKTTTSSDNDRRWVAVRTRKLQFSKLLLKNEWGELTISGITGSDNAEIEKFWTLNGRSDDRKLIKLSLDLLWFSEVFALMY